ncbi:winged helix DNA-binding domain-containing protein [Couchioplanes caeruleus]|uniref:winged helix DNA-binding domain-containing protein n=1 Tax=Couchioplanes caeruleus TaxID=56438 RepID=UPI0020C004B1|nr:winged helix DNA-binding domain-containing protein [Couchioplanes caeruleus]UQU62222.1 winged helix DNA-binding domain-containing protein [Couchioplanes caeruleus]
MARRISKEGVIAFRLAAHHLTERLNEDGLLAAAGRCGVQNSPPGSALLALHARVRDMRQERLDHVVAEEKSLLQTWSMRGAPFFLPTADAPVFTTGVLPPTEEALRHFVLGVQQSVDRLGVSLAEAVELTGHHMGEVLAGRRLAIDELGGELAARIACDLPKGQRDVWEEEGPYAAGQAIGEAVVHFCIRILTLRQVVCLAPRVGNKAPFVLLNEWLGHSIPRVDPDVARGELLRRYLHCYGPSTRADFAAWVGVRVGDTGPWWSPVRDELRQVEFGGTSWILTGDLDALQSSAIPDGVRLLPPSDPYTQLRDRDTIVDKKHHRAVWTTVGAPGTILTDGRIAGIWRSRRSGRKLAFTIKPFGSMPQRDRKALNDEAEQIAALRGASSVDIVFADEDDSDQPPRFLHQ